MEGVLDEGGQHHGHQDGVLRGLKECFLHLVSSECFSSSKKCIVPYSPFSFHPSENQREDDHYGLQTSNPKTSWTEAPRVMILWQAWLTNRKSRTASSTMRAVCRARETMDQTGDQSKTCVYEQTSRVERYLTDP